jgi:hypothetical protein
MNTTTQQNRGFNFHSLRKIIQSKTVAFLFGAVFNILANTDNVGLIGYSIKATIAGIIMLLFNLLADYVCNRLSKKRIKNAMRQRRLEKLKRHKK